MASVVADESLESEVRRNVGIFFDSKTTLEVRNAVDKWLNSYQLTEKAWGVSHSLLTRDMLVDSTVLYFAANTLHKKARHDAADLSPVAVDQLLVSILNLCFSAVPPNVSGRLALAYVALSVHKSTLNSTGGENPLEPIMRLSFFAPNLDAAQQSVTAGAAVSILSVVLEESTDDELPVHRPDRDRFVESIRSCGIWVLDFLASCLSHGVPSKQRVFACFSSWIRYGFIDPAVIAVSPLLGQIFRELAVDTIVHLLRCYRFPDRDAVLIEATIPLVMSLCPRLSTDDAEDAARVLAEMGESFMPIICGPVDMGQVAIVSALADAANHDDTSVAQMTFPFWSHLGDVLVDGRNDDEHSQGRESVLLKEFLPHVGRTAGACFKHMSTSIDDEELRSHLGECLGDCCKLLGWEICMVEAGKYFQHACNDVATVDAVRAALHCLVYVVRAGGAYRVVRETAVVPAVLQMLPGLFDGHAGVKYVGIDLVGECAEWINAHPFSLNQLFPYVVGGLQEPETASMSATVLCTLCRVCADSMPPTVLTVYDSASIGHLSHNDKQKIVEGMSSVVSRLPFQDAQAGLQRLLEPMAEVLLKLLGASEGGDTRTAMCEALDRMVSVFRYAKLRVKLPAEAIHPAIVLMDYVWPLFEQIIVRCNSNEWVMEKVARVYKHVIRNAGPHFLPLLDKLLVQLIEVIETYPISSFVYTCSVCVSEFGSPDNEVAVRTRLLSAYAQITNSMCTHIKDAHAFNSSPALVEDYFHLSCRLGNKAGDLLLSPAHESSLTTALQIGLLGLKMDHPAVWPTVAAFFETIFRIRRPEEWRRRVIDLYKAYGLTMMKTLLWALAGGVDRRFVDDDDDSNACVGSLLYLLVELEPTLSRAMLAQCAEDPAIVPGLSSPEAFNEFSTKIFNSADKAEFYRQVFRFHCSCSDRAARKKRAATKAMFESGNNTM